jgi:hypothetical protein
VNGKTPEIGQKKPKKSNSQSFNSLDAESQALLSAMMQGRPSEK